MGLLRKSNKPRAAREQIDILGVEGGTLQLTDNRYRKVFEVSSINFELKSEDEQDALIEIYKSFLNSLSCPIQYLIRTREIDLDGYLHELEEQIEAESLSIYKNQLINYQKFLRSLVTTNQILSRRFYVILPYKDKNASQTAVEVREQLNLNSEIVQKGFQRLGIQVRGLSSIEILDLFYTFYNPEQAKVQPIVDQTLDILHSSFIQRTLDENI